MPAKIDLIGFRNGPFVVVAGAEKGKSRSAMWEVLCDCGKRSVKPASMIRHHKYVFCSGSCFLRCPDETGMQYGKWTVVNVRVVDGRRRYLCRCVCGNENMVFSCDLRAGRSTQCRSCSYDTGSLWKQDTFVWTRVRNALYSDKKRGRNNPYTHEELMEALGPVPHKCPYCAVELTRGQGGTRDRNAASVDAIDPAEAHVPGNITWSCWGCNMLKWDGSLVQLRGIVSFLEMHHARSTAA